MEQDIIKLLKRTDRRTRRSILGYALKCLTADGLARVYEYAAAVVDE